MKVAVYHSNSDIRLEERPVPAIGAGEILVRMMASGICGTDVMEWYRKRKAPCVLGHEMAGEVVAVDAAVTGIKTGDRVFVAHHVPCLACRYCRAGNYSACEMLHSGNYDPGGFAEYVRIPAENVRQGTLLLPDNVSYAEATMIEPLACAVAAQKRVHIRPGQTVLVIGAGVSGLSHIPLAKLAGARIIASDLSAFRRQKAQDFGADAVIDAAAFSVDGLRQVNDGQLPETVILCAGAQKAVADALASVDRKGTVIFFAVPQDDIKLPSVRCWRDELELVFAYGAARDDLKEALALIASGHFDSGQMISHRLPISQIQRGFAMVAQAGDSLKVIVEPDEVAGAD